MKSYILAIVAIAAAFASCKKDPGKPKPNVNLNVGVNSGGIWIGVSVGFGGGYYYPTYNPNNPPQVNTFVLFVPRAPGKWDLEVPVVLRDTTTAFDPFTGQQISSARFDSESVRKYLSTFDYTKGLAPVLVTRDATPNGTDPVTGKPIYGYKIL